MANEYVDKLSSRYFNSRTPAAPRTRRRILLSSTVYYPTLLTKFRVDSSSGLEVIQE